MSIGSNIKKRRYELGMSQDELAKQLGYKSRSTIAKIEADENNLNTKKLAQFAKVLDTSVQELITGLNNNNVQINQLSKGHQNIAIVLAGGKSLRNQQNIPNQFINVLGKPVIMYCLETYQNHPAISQIYVVCLKGWENILQSYCQQFNISKLQGIIQAGDTGIMSIKNALEYLQNKINKEDTIIFQESTRPMVSQDNITRLLLEYANKGSAVTCGSMADHLQFLLNENNIKYIDRNYLVETQSPEAYKYIELLNLFKKAQNKNHQFNESCVSMLMYNLGLRPNLFEGDLSNIKIIRQEDLTIFTALLKANN